MVASGLVEVQDVEVGAALASQLQARVAGLETEDAALERFDLLTSGSHAAVWDWDYARDTIWCSPHFYTIIGATPETFVATTAGFRARLHPNDVGLLDDALVAHLAEGAPYKLQFRLLTDAGHYRWVQTSGEFARPDDGTPRRMVGTLSDIHAQKLNEMRLEQSVDELRQFAYAASHDLKAPLRHIKSFSQLLEKELSASLTERIRLLLGFLVDGVDRMDAVIDGVHRVAQVESDTLTMKMTTVGRVVAAARSIVLGNEGVAGVGGPLHLEVAADAEVYCEPTLLVRVIQNALENCLRYRRPDAQARVTVSATRTATHTEIAIDDDGVGIQPHHRERVFLIFSRLSHDTGGTGVGLAICRKIIALHDGEIWFDDPVGECGARLRIRIPV